MCGTFTIELRKRTMAERNSWNMKRLVAALGDLVKEVRGNTGAALMPVLTDSRKIVPGAVFVALRGQNFDGHDFVKEVAAKGAGLVITDHVVGCSCPEIVVADTAEAYGALARSWRAQFNIPMICVVGSNGKTTTTQMIASILRAYCGESRVLATQGNYNNEIGVPQTLLRLTTNTKVAVVEAGMNHEGEMARLAGWIRPTVVVVTNAQREHQEFLNGVMASARENAYAIVSLSAKGTAVLPVKDSAFGLWYDYVRARGCKMVTYCQGESDLADVSAAADDETLDIRAFDCEIQTKLRLFGNHAVHDAAAAAAACLVAGVNPEAVAQGLAAFEPVKGRGVRHQLPNGAVVIDDAYNANPDSMLAAVDVLASMPAPRVLILGDMAEVGEESAACHAEIGAYAKQRGIDRLFAEGPEMKHAVKSFGAGARHFESVADLAQAAKVAASTPGTLLIKASNSRKLNRVVEALVGESDAKTQRQ